jgi:hypothetical protein
MSCGAPCDLRCGAFRTRLHHPRPSAWAFVQDDVHPLRPRRPCSTRRREFARHGRQSTARHSPCSMTSRRGESDLTRAQRAREALLARGRSGPTSGILSCNGHILLGAARGTRRPRLRRGFRAAPRRMEVRTLALGLVALAAVACRTSAAGTIPAALLSTAVAGGVAAARRADGQCYTPCVPGTACNLKTGTCDPLPCRGQCSVGEQCDESAALPRCVRAPEPTLSLTHPAAARTPPAPEKADLPRVERGP